MRKNTPILCALVWLVVQPHPHARSQSISQPHSRPHSQSQPHARAHTHAHPQQAGRGGSRARRRNGAARPATAQARRVVSTDHAPRAIGPYSQAVVAGGFVFCSGQIGSDPATGRLVVGGTREQTEQALKNLAAVLEAAGSDLAHVTKTTVFLADMDDFAVMNEVYQRHFGTDFPARSTVQVARLPRDARVEIEAVALVKKR